VSHPHELALSSPARRRNVRREVARSTIWELSEIAASRRCVAHG
jgi:hypothetical protein